LKFLNYLKKTLTGLYSSLRRFPSTILLSASVAGVLIYINETNPKTDDLSRIALALALGIPVSLCIKLLFERKEDKNPVKYALGYAAGALFLAGYYFFLLKDMSMVTGSRYIAVNLAFYMAFLFLPHFFKKEQFEMYVVAVFTGFFITIIYSAVLYAGLSAILFTIDKLLLIQVLGKVYYYTFLFVAFIFAVSYFLAEIPLKTEELTPEKYPRLLRILLLYIVIPLLTAYTAILYIYFGKIIMTRVWPIGIVSHLVLWYAVIVTVVMFFITPVKDERAWQKNFFRLAPIIIIPLIIMMFVSIGIRINAYGVTEKRYYVVILGLWLLSMMLYLIFFSKKLRNIIMPVSLAIVALIAVFGPVSSYQISMMSQNSRFQQFLAKTDMLKDGKIQPSANVSKDDIAQMSSIIDYFNNQHSLKDVKFLPEGFKISDMKASLGFEFEYTSTLGNNGYFYYQRDSSERGIDISGYDYLFDAGQYNNSTGSSGSPVNVTYNYDTSLLKVFYNDKEVYSDDFNAFVKALIDKHGIPSQDSKESMLPASEMAQVTETDKLKIKVVYMSISGNVNQSQSIEGKGIEFYVLIKVK
jgi:hypothetical protein